MATTAAALVVKLIERQDGRCVLYLRRIGEGKRRQRFPDRTTALASIRTELDLRNDHRASSEISAVPAAKIETANAIQPRSSLLAFWRRLISMSIRKASPVRGSTPDNFQAKSSFVMARKSLHVLWGFEDIGTYLKEIRKRHALCRTSWNHYAYPHDEMSDFGHLIAVDIPRLVALVEKLKKERK